jgi:hypothetical protein
MYLVIYFVVLYADCTCNSIQNAVYKQKIKSQADGILDSNHGRTKGLFIKRSPYYHKESDDDYCHIGYFVVV